MRGWLVVLLFMCMGACGSRGKAKPAALELFWPDAALIAPPPALDAGSAQPLDAAVID